MQCKGDNGWYKAHIVRVVEPSGDDDGTFVVRPDQESWDEGTIGLTPFEVRDIRWFSAPTQQHVIVEGPDAPSKAEQEEQAKSRQEKKEKELAQKKREEQCRDIRDMLPEGEEGEGEANQSEPAPSPAPEKPENPKVADIKAEGRIEENLKVKLLQTRKKGKDRQIKHRVHCPPSEPSDPVTPTATPASASAAASPTYSPYEFGNLLENADTIAPVDLTPEIRLQYTPEVRQPAQRPEEKYHRLAEELTHILTDPESDIRDLVFRT